MSQRTRVGARGPRAHRALPCTARRIQRPAGRVGEYGGALAVAGRGSGCLRGLRRAARGMRTRLRGLPTWLRAVLCGGRRGLSGGSDVLRAAWLDPKHAQVPERITGVGCGEHSAAGPHHCLAFAELCLGAAHHHGVCHRLLRRAPIISQSPRPLNGNPDGTPESRDVAGSADTAQPHGGEGLTAARRSDGPLGIDETARRPTSHSWWSRGAICPLSPSGNQAGHGAGNVSPGLLTVPTLTSRRCTCRCSSPTAGGNWCTGT